MPRSNCLKIVMGFALSLLVAPAQGQSFAIVAKPDSAISARYLEFFTQELAKRTTAPFVTVGSVTGVSTDALVLGAPAQLRNLLGGSAFARWQATSAKLGRPDEPEAFTVVPITIKGHKTLVLSAQPGRAQLFALGWFLRHANISQDSIQIPSTLPFITTPEKGVRGYQIGYRMKNNTYDAWTLAQFRQQMLDMAVFGMNTMQAVAPLSDDAPTSPLFPAPAQETAVGLSRMSQEYGLRFDLFYPEMENDYADPKQLAAELTKFENLVRSLPLVDSVHVPGGDPGHTPPALLMPLVEQEMKILRRYHPKAEMWISAQGLNADGYRQFYKILQSQPRYITGIFFGPQSREGMELQRKQIPARYPIEFYPDTAHVMHAQFPIPKWDPIYALTEGREPICPRPFGFEAIYRHFHALNSGFIVYSEGVNDDVNKVLWAGWGWRTSASTHDILRQYARYFFAANDSDAERTASAIESLEKNWDGPLLHNTTIASTLQTMEGLHLPMGAGNWRYDLLRYRATYDRYLQIKRGRELAAETSALSHLEDASLARDRIAAARLALVATHPDAEEQQLHESLLQLAAALYKECGLQLSVKLYGASNWYRGANLDRIDTPLNNRAWIEGRLLAAEALGGTAERAALDQIVTWQHPAPGSFYDDLGDPANEPHLLRGQGWENDPEMYLTANDGLADETLEKGWRLSWLDYAETLYEQPLRLHYEHLERDASYRIRVTYAGEDYALPMQLTANGIVIQPMRMRASNPAQVEFAIPASATHEGTLTVEWTRAPGAGGSGRGGQVAEVWLLKQ